MSYLSAAVFQTNPRGVEAEDSTVEVRRDERFQTNPRGVEARSTDASRGGARVSDEPSWG